MKPALIAVLALLLAAPAANALDLGRTTTVDRPAGTLPFDGVSDSTTRDRSLSDDGRYVTFESGSDALFGPNPGYANGIYRVDLQTGTVVLASIAPDGTPIPGDVTNPTISGTGRYIAFQTEVGVIPADGNGLSDIYVRDLQNGLTALVSCLDKVPCEVSSTASSHDPVISGDGASVAFRTEADLTDLTIDDTDDRVDVYVRSGGETHLASVNENDAADNSDHDVGEIDINGDGTSVAFTTGTDLQTVPAVDDAPAADDDDVFVRTGIGAADPADSGTECASHGGTAVRVAIGGRDPSIATSDRVAFVTSGNVGTDTDADTDAYTQRGVTTAAPILMSAADGTADGDHSTTISNPLLSSSGADATFTANGPGLVPGADGVHVYLRDGTATAIVDRADGAAGAPTTESSFNNGFARDGSAVGFSTAQAVDPADGLVTDDIYVRDGISTEWASKPPSGPTQLQAGGGGLNDQAMTTDGRYVVFASTAPIFGTPAGIYRRDLATGEVVRIDVAVGGGAPNDGSFSARISADGTRVSFSSRATNLVAGDGDTAQDVFVRDLVTGVTRIALDSPQSVGGGELSADGKRVLVSTTGAIDPADSNVGNDAYVVDVDTGAATLASRNAAGEVQADTVQGQALSGDGNRVVFTTVATNMPDGDAQADAYVRDIAAQTTTVVSRTASGGTPDASVQTSDVDISADGNRVAFQTQATNLGDGDTDAQGDIHVRDLTTGALIWGSRLATGPLNDNGFSAVLNGDGHKLLFSSQATNADPADSSVESSGFLKDLDTGALTLAARSDDGSSPAGGLTTVAITDDAGCVAFATDGGGIEPFGYPSRDYPHVYVHALARTCPGTPIVPGPDPTPPPGPGPGGDTTKPVISGLTVKSARKRRVTVTFQLSEDADVRLRALRLLRGTRRDGKCGRKRPRGKRCTRLVARGTVTRAAQQGEVKIVLKGKAGKRRLARGRHRVELRATDAAGNESDRKRSKRFRVKR